MTARSATRGRQWLPAPATVAALTAYAVVAGSLAPYSWPMRIATGAVCATVALDAVRHGWLRSRRDSMAPPTWPGPSASLVVWLVLIGAVLAVQLAMYVSSPRSAYPTLSSLASDAFGVWPVRMGGFGLWSWVGWYVVRR